MKQCLALILMLVFVTCLCGCGRQQEEEKEIDVEVKSMTTILTEDTTTVMHNPDMGWVIYDNFIISPSESSAYMGCGTFGYDFPGVDYVMLKYTWADIEKQKDVYDFEKFDYIYDYWHIKGKTIMLGMSTDSLLWYGSNGTGVPRYVLDALPDGAVQTRQYNNGSSYLKYDVCDANEPYYQERLRLFLQAMESHMKDTGRTVDYIDLRGYGLWGEWHQGYKYETLEKKRTALEQVMRIWSESFPEQHLALSYSYDPDEPYMNYSMKNKLQDYLYWSAFDLALQFPNITLRRDGCGGAVKVNERLFCEQVFAACDRGPFTSEGCDGYTGHDRAWSIVEDGLTLHPNYFTLVGWTNAQGKQFIENEPEMFEYALIHMGYRFSALGVAYPSAAKQGGDITITSVWKNTGVGRAVRDYELWAVLTDARGEVTSFPIGKTDCSQWIAGKEYTSSITGKVPKTVKKGEYTLHLALYDAKTEKFIQLANQEKAEGGSWYKLGTFQVF